MGSELGSAAADCFSWAAPQVGRNSTLHYSLSRFSCGGSTVTSATSDRWAKPCRPVVTSSGVGARCVKIWGPPPPGMSRRHPSSSCGVGARTGGWPRDSLPHPFKVKLGDHFSGAPEITPGWGLAPGCGTHGHPPLPERISWVATPIYHDLGHHSILGCAHDLGHRETLGSEPSRMSLTSVTFGLVASTAAK